MCREAQWAVGVLAGVSVAELLINSFSFSLSPVMNGLLGGQQSKAKIASQG